MAKYELKTKKNKASVSKFINSIEDDQKRKDSKEIIKIIKDLTGEKPVMWGPSIVGFGSYHYKYASGQEGDWMITGFSPRKQNLTIYIMPGYDLSQDLLDKLGPHKTGKSCLYIKKLEDVHLPTLKKLILRGYKEMKKKNPSA
jgi:hypothetical protein